jgi:hypothetical protein
VRGGQLLFSPGPGQEALCVLREAVSGHVGAFGTRLVWHACIICGRQKGDKTT